MVILWLACATPEPDPVALLEGPRLLRRVSLDLRGTLPTVQELASVEDDPTLVDTYAAEWIESPAFEEQLIHRLAERWWTRTDVFPIEYQDYALGPSQEYAFERSVGEEPLRLAARIVVEDRPWSEVVTAEHTLANAMLLDIWPMTAERDPGEGEWIPATYTDGRPHAGVLTTNGLWWRYDTDVSNLNRRRIAAVTRILLCEDYLVRPVSFAERDVDADVSQAVLQDPACTACHASLDPAAGALMGFWWVVDYSEPEFATYHPERERLASEWLSVEPAWHGVPISGPADLGAQIARDPRFESCAVSSTAELYWRRTSTGADEPTLDALRADFEGAQSLKALILEVLKTEAYRAPDERLLTPYQLDAAVGELTGLSWIEEGVRMLDADPSGMRVLAGGLDGLAATQPQTAPGLTRTLVFKRFAELAAATAVGTPVLEDPNADLFFRLLGERPSPTELAELDALEAAVSEVAPDQARAAVLAALLRDPDFVTY